MLHGIPTWSYLYNDVIPDLADNYRVIAPDFLGHGWSDKRDRSDRALVTQAKMILRFLDALNLDRVNLVGHDTGGGLSNGLSRPQRLTAEFQEGIVAPYGNEEGKISLIRNASALNTNHIMSLVDRHSEITAPTLLLWGVDDPWQTINDGDRLLQELPHAKLVRIENASHWVPQDAPKEFAQAIAAFLETDFLATS